VHKREQLELLERLRIHYSFKPLLVPELERFRDKCGSTNYSGDGEGIFVFAVIPGFQYNLIRRAALAPDAADDPLLFRAVILREIPQSIQNPFGGFSYEKLAQANFQYRVPGGFDDKEVTQGFIGDLVQEFGDTIEAVGNGIGEFFAEIDKAVSGTVQITVDLSILNRDPLFGRDDVLRRAWGARTGDELAVDGLRTEIFTTALIIVPEISTGTTNDIGVARVEVPQGSEGVSICWELDNHAAFLRAEFNNYDICDHRIAHLGEYNASRRIEYRTDAREAHAMAQLDDGFHYMRSVVGFEPTQADVRFGGLIGNLPGSRAFTPCLDFPNLAIDFIGAVMTIAIPPAGIAFWIATGSTRVDMMIPYDSNATESRAIMTHEYGHYAFCDLLFDRNPLDGLPNVLLDRIAEGADPDETDDETGILLEAFADFFALQVAGGVNYFRPTNPAFSNDIASNLNVDYCRRPPDTDYGSVTRRLTCIDQNFVGTEEFLAGAAGTRLIGARVSLFHDAFDRAPARIDAYTANVPNDARAYRFDATSGTLFIQLGPSSTRMRT
jgi:hypothetical protein